MRLAADYSYMLQSIAVGGSGNGADETHTSTATTSSLSKNQTAIQTSLPAISHSTKTTNNSPITVAYAVSLIQCSNAESHSSGLSDASIVLRHSIHQNSVRNPTSGSRYDYHMIAIVHTKAKECASELERAGFTILIRDTPVTPKDVVAPVLQKRMHRALCCGHDEFIKLYAYKLVDYPIVVHMDMDFVIHKPLDDLFDVLLDNTNQAARQRIELEFPERGWPSNIQDEKHQVQAMFTRDWPQVIPGRKAAYQAGFMAIKPSPAIFDEIVHVIKTSNFTDGYGRDNGWGGLGYGAFVGDMAMQGVIAYYYDQFKPQQWIELDQCTHNHMGMSVTARGGVCRNGRAECENCQVTELSRIHSIHYSTYRIMLLCRWWCLFCGFYVHFNHYDCLPYSSLSKALELHWRGTGYGPRQIGL